MSRGLLAAVEAMAVTLALGSGERGWFIERQDFHCFPCHPLCLDLSSLFSTLLPLLFLSFAPVCRVHPVSRLHLSRHHHHDDDDDDDDATAATFPTVAHSRNFLHRATSSTAPRLNHPDYETIHPLESRRFPCNHFLLPPLLPFHRERKDRRTHHRVFFLPNAPAEFRPGQ